jgi:hypothetical protein
VSGVAPARPAAPGWRAAVRTAAGPDAGAGNARVVGHLGRQGDEGASAPVRPSATPVLDLLAVAIGRGVARVLVPRRRAPAVATPAPTLAPTHRPAGLQAGVQVGVQVGARSRARLQLVRGGPLADG